MSSLLVQRIAFMVTQASDKLVPLGVARRTLIPPNENGKPVNPSTVWRWVRKGFLGVDDERIRLEVTYRGNAPYTTAEAVDRFFSQVTAAKLERARRADAMAADVTDDELREAGLLSGGAQ
jgi:hypothetical protein